MAHRRLALAFAAALAVHLMLAWWWRGEPSPPATPAGRTIAFSLIRPPAQSIEKKPKIKENYQKSSKNNKKIHQNRRGIVKKTLENHKKPKANREKEEKINKTAQASSRRPHLPAPGGKAQTPARQKAAAQDAPHLLAPQAADWFRHRIRYPWLAQRMGWQGVVALEMEVSARKVHKARVVRSSGFAVLDQAALAGVQGAKGAPVEDGRWRLFVRFALR